MVAQLEGLRKPETWKTGRGNWCRAEGKALGAPLGPFTHAGCTEASSCRLSSSRDRAAEVLPSPLARPQLTGTSWDTLQASHPPQTTCKEQQGLGGLLRAKRQVWCHGPALQLLRGGEKHQLPGS